jgi:hypothetical protein
VVTNIHSFGEKGIRLKSLVLIKIGITNIERPCNQTEHQTRRDSLHVNLETIEGKQWQN